MNQNLYDEWIREDRSLQSSYVCAAIIQSHRKTIEEVQDYEKRMLILANEIIGDYNTAYNIVKSLDTQPISLERKILMDGYSISACYYIGRYLIDVKDETCIFKYLTIGIHYTGTPGEDDLIINDYYLVGTSMNIDGVRKMIDAVKKVQDRNVIQPNKNIKDNISIIIHILKDLL